MARNNCPCSSGLPNMVHPSPPEKFKVNIRPAYMPLVCHLPLHAADTAIPYCKLPQFM